MARYWMSLPNWMNRTKAAMRRRSPRTSSSIRSVGIFISVGVAAIAVYVLTHTLRHIDHDRVLQVIRHTNVGLIALAARLVATSYASLTLYDLLALRTIGRTEIPYRIAALASFTSYPIAHGIGAVSLISPVIRYRIYSHNGLGAFEVANICFLTGLTFWLGNLTALGIGLLFAPNAISVVDFLPPQVNRWLAGALLLTVLGFLLWCRASPRNIGTKRWPVRLPSGPLVFLQIVIGLVDLGAAALAMYVLIPAGPNIGIFPIMAIFIAATLLGFASHTPAGLGVFDAAFLIGLGNNDKEPLVAALLMFRLLYHFLPFVFALLLFGLVEAWRSLRGQRRSPNNFQASDG
jgi:glycosyltransferase 2 family protein